VSSDVPTAGKGAYELKVGYVLEDDGAEKERELPALELICGLTERQEINVVVPFLRRAEGRSSARGLGDVALGTKYRFLGQPDSEGGLSVSLEVTLPTGSRSRGLGSGTSDVEMLARWGWEMGPEVLYFNLGRTWVGESGSRDPWFLSGVWDHPIGSEGRLLLEVYHETADEPGSPDRLAATLGTKWDVRPQQEFHFSVGRSLRARAKGGPKLRIYAGWRWDF
jgi:hypothetical protein